MRQLHLRGGRLALAAASLVLATAAAAACSDGEERECRIGADCASGACTPEGTCVRAGGSAEAGATPDGGSPVDGAPTIDAAIDAALPGCTPNKDGVVTREEVPITAGLYAKFRVGRAEDVSTAGTPAGAGKRTWDFTAALASDVNVLVETQPLAGKWYAPKFTGATYAAKLQEGSELLGVFEVSPGAILLRGVVSPNDDLTKTELTNDPAVAALKFPLQAGATWTTTTDVSGTAQGVVLFGTYKEVYTSEVDATGQLKTPLGTFDVLRVHTKLVRNVGVLPSVTIHTFAFVTECYGTVATVRSEENETNVEFTRAAEIRRITP